MCSTITPKHAAGQNAVRNLPPNTTAGALIPLKTYLDKAVITSAAKLVPPSGTTLPPNVRSTHVPISLMPLTNNGQNLDNYYAGVFDDEMHFSASLVKVAALFAAGQFHAEAKAFATNFATWSSFLTAFNASLKAEINATADTPIKNAGLFMTPQTATILKPSAFPTIAFADAFKNSLARMIVQSDDDDAGICIRALGYGYINTALKQANFFNSSTGIWLAATYHKGDPMVRIPCVNDHPDGELTTSRLMCRLMAMIRLGQLPQNDADANSLMQGWLNEPKTGGTGPWLGHGRGNTVGPLFSILQDKIGFAGLGSDEIPLVYSEGLIIKWNDTSQLDTVNNKIDPTNAHPEIHLSGEIALCWQNLLDDLIPPPPGNFDGIIEVMNNSISGFLNQTPV